MIDLVVVPCGARKAPTPRAADMLYIGSYFRACYRAAVALGPRRVLILSAKYGLVRPSQVIAPYEQTFGAAGAIDRSRLRAQAEELGVEDADPVVVLAGRRYVEEARSIWPHADAPLQRVRGGMGKQLTYLSELSARGSL